MTLPPVPASHVRLKRAYAPADPGDGVRLLVDRLWPRGVSKQDAALDEWVKDIAPSTQLRKWFGHDPARWDGFVKKYRDELREHEPELAKIRARAARETITLVYGARDEQHNEAVVLREVILSGSTESNT